MLFILSILFAAAYTATGVVASPASTAVEIGPGLFMETYDFGEMALDSNVSVGGAPADGGLAKRAHVDCWDNHMTVRQNQEAYEDDCELLIEGIRRRSSTRQLAPRQSVLGWGMLNNDRDLVYILEPYEVAPPTYSPRCQ
ncbi:hypothetical protein NQ176_g240 [Zarea fungicola]|uniref:Uncharacterized protein n=1 Tax=Zarea fungicola TaxID=93591 RepID=A0ACC1P0H5_9HYPO|nr:hypothetical protein NQ176_g240 [Lecanicillium fungicola]